MRSRYLGTILLSAVIALVGVTPARPEDSDRPGKGQPRHNVIVVVADGLRADAVNPTDAPTMWRLRNSGVSFANSHAVFPTFTTPNAAAIATGHFPGDTGDFSNALFTGFPVFSGQPPSFTGKSPGTNVPFIEDDQVLGDIDEHFPGGNFLSEEALLAFGRRHGFHTAAVGKLGPTLIQDVTQGNPLNGAFATPDTVVIDDRTGTTSGLPLSAAIRAALQNSGLALATPPRTQPAGNNVTPGTRDANVAQQQYFVDAITKAVLPTFKADGAPFILVYWSRDPDGSQHNQGDSLNTLVPGINGPTSKAAIKNADNNLKQILDFIQADPDLAAKTDVFVTADHGFSTISRHDLDASGSRFTKSYAATQTYRETNGRQEVNAAFLPPGFVAIDLAHALGLPLFDPDSQITVSGTNVYAPVDPTIPQPTATVRQRPASGNGLIGGSGGIGDPTDAKVVVAANGGSNLIYVNGHDPALVRRIVGVLAQQDYTGGIFVDDAYGRVPGALPLSAIHLKGSAALPTPAVVLNFRSFPTDPANRLLTMVEIADTGLQQGQGMHGSFSRADTFNFMAAIGPDFKQGFVDHAPVSNADLAVTFADILGFDLSGKGPLSGRVLEEALARGHAAPPVAHHVRVSPRIPGSKLRTVLLFQTLDKHVYADEACFTALPMAHDGQDDDHVQVVSPAQHANLCASAALP
jgi:Type I phosphodiesterase / nucleotide pyrophosphatase